MEKSRGKGVVLSNPIPYKTRSGVYKAKVDVQIDDVKATYWSDDTHDKHLFSFQQGDKVDVEYWQRGNFWNCEIVSAKGSVSNPEGAANDANDKMNQPTGDFAHTVEELATLYGAIRAEVMASEKIAETVAAGELSDELREEVYRQATASIFIEANRRNLSYAEAFNL